MIRNPRAERRRAAKRLVRARMARDHISYHRALKAILKELK
jgi:hypothetical protein